MTAATGTAPAEVAAWMDAAVAGDREAFGRLYELYRPQILRFLGGRIGYRTAVDLADETFCRALARIGTYTWQGRDPGAWFVTIARNLVADHVKSCRYRLEVPCEDMRDVDRPDRAVDREPEAATLRHLAADEIRAVLAKLTPDQSQVLRLRYLHGLSVAETARAMGRSESAVKGLTWRGLQAAAAAMRRDVPHRRRPDAVPAGRIVWRCRSCGTTSPRSRHDSGTPCGAGWLEPIEVS